MNQQTSATRSTRPTTQPLHNSEASVDLPDSIRWHGLDRKILHAPESGGPFHRGQTVVVQSERGLELGEVLIDVDDTNLPDSDSNHGHETHENDAGDSVATATVVHACVLRAAASDDLARATQIDDLRPMRLAQCQRIIEEEGWPWEIVDIEPLLDGTATVLHYLGPQPRDAALVRARFRAACDFDVLLEPVGGEPEDIESDDGDEEEHGCGGGGSCGSCSHGSEAASGRARLRSIPALQIVCPRQGTVERSPPLLMAAVIPAAFAD